MFSSNRYLPLLLAMALAGLAGAGCTKEIRRARHLARGDKEFQAQQYDQAEIEYLNVLKVSPGNPVAMRQLGIIYQEEGRPARAQQYLRRACELEPGNSQLHTERALNALSLGDVKTAREQATLVLSKKPGDAEALEALASAAVTSNSVQQVEEQIQKLRQADQDRASYHVAFGALWLRRQDLSKAEAEFKKALELDPKCSSALVAMGNYYWSRKDLAAAEQAFKSGAELAPIRSAKRLKYVEFKLMTGKTDEAKGLLDSITKQAPDYLPAWDYLAQIAFSEKKYDDCLSVLQRVLGREPYDFDALMLSGSLSLLKGQKAEALNTYTRMASLYGHSPQVQFQLARAYLLNNDMPKAMTCLNQAITAAPDFADAVLLQANLNIRKGDIAAAIASLEQLIKRQPRLGQAYLLLADAYSARKDLDQAVVVCQRMARLFPNSPEVQLLIGSLLERQNKLGDARQAFEKALALAPESLAPVEQLVNLDIKEQRYQPALDRVEKVIAKNPKAAEPLLLVAQVHIAEAENMVAAENKKRANPAGPELTIASVPAAQPEANQAEAALLKAIDLNPGLNNAYLMLAQIYVAAGKQQQALDRLNGLLSRTNNAAALMQVGMLHESLHDYSAAKDSYEKLLTLAPDFGPALNNLANLYAEHFNDLDKAYQLAQKAHDASPSDPATTDTLGWILYKRGDYVHALSLLEDSSSKLRNEPEIQYHLGITQYMLGDEDHARASLQLAAQSPKQFAGKDQAARCLAILAINPQTADGSALTALQKRLQDAPQDVIALDHLGAIQERDGALDKALETYQTELKANQQNGQLMFKIARLYLSSSVNDPAKALAMAKNAHDLLPDDPRIAALLGRLVFGTGDSKWATSLLEDSARRLPDDPRVAFDLAWAYYSQGRVSDAQGLMGKAANSAAGFRHADEAKRFQAAVQAANDPAQAKAYGAEAQKILSADPNYVPALMISGIDQEGQGNYQAAAELYKKVLARFPSFTPASRNLGLLDFAHLGDDQAAYDLLTKARQAAPQDAQVAKALGVIAYRKGNYSRAAQLLKESARARSGDAELLYYLGMAQYQLKAKSDSKASLQQALTFKLPSKLADDARRVLAELK